MQFRSSIRSSLFALVIGICWPILASAQTVPAGTAETITGKKIVLPDGVRGHVSIFIVGFSHKSKDLSDAWNKSIRQEFAQDHQLQVYQVAHLEGAPGIMRGMIVSSIRKGVPPAQQENFLVLTEGQNAWKQWVGFSAPDDAYIVLVDKSGQSTWKTHGSFNDAALAELKKQVAQAESK